MDLALWIVAGWFCVATVTAFAVAKFIRDNRGGQESVPLPARVAAFRPRNRG